MNSGDSITTPAKPTPVTVLGRRVSGREFVDLSNPTLNPDEKEAILVILSYAKIIHSDCRLLRDMIEGSDEVVPYSVRSDGVWIWNDSLLYYLREHNVGLPAEFVDFYRDRGFEPLRNEIPELSVKEIHTLGHWAIQP